MTSPPSSSAAEEDPTPVRPPYRSDNEIPEQQAPQSMEASSSATAAGQLQNPTENTASVVPPVNEINSPQTVTVVSGPEANVNSGEHTATQKSKRSFAEVTNSGAKKSQSLRHLFGNTPALPGASLISQDGKDVLMFNDDITSILTESLKWALVGKFSHGVPSIQLISKFFSNLNLAGKFELRWLSQRQVLVVLNEEADYIKVWLQGLWHIAGFSMRVLKWTPLYNAKVESSIVPIWAKLPGLPAHLYERRALYLIASMLGKPLEADSATAKRTRASVARVCVEIDLHKPLMNNILLGINGKLIDQVVIYENMPNYCSFCCHIGHEVVDCYIKNVDLNATIKKQEMKRSKDKGKSNVIVDKACVDKIKDKNNALQGLKSVDFEEGEVEIGVETSNSFQALEITEVEIGEQDSRVHPDTVSQFQGEGKVDAGELPSQAQAVKVPTNSGHTGQTNAHPQSQCITVSDQQQSANSPNKQQNNLAHSGQHSLLPHLQCENPSAQPQQASSPIKNQMLFQQQLQNFLPITQLQAPHLPEANQTNTSHFPPKQIVKYHSPPIFAKPLNTMYHQETSFLHDAFFPDMDTVQVNLQGAMDMICRSQGSEFSDDEYDEDFREMALHRGCSTPDFKQRNNKSAFNEGYNGRITRSMAKFC